MRFASSGCPRGIAALGVLSVVTLLAACAAPAGPGGGALTVGTTENRPNVSAGVLADLASTGVIRVGLPYAPEPTTLFVQRDYAKRLTLSVVMDNSRLNGLFAALAALRATPCVWIGSDDAELAGTLIVYGFYRDFTIDIAYPEQSLCSLEIEGLT